MGYHGEPFIWDEERRAFVRAELDANYANLYGLARDELRYILDPQNVYGPGFPGETFRVLKKKEIKLYGECRTRPLVLEVWDRLEGVTSAAVPMRREESAPEGQPMLSDFGLYKCGICGKMVMGYERENHQKEKHGGKSGEWKKMGS